MASSFFRLIFAGPGYIPLPNDDPEKTVGTADPTITADMFVCEPGGYPRWCKTCQIIKPDRAHHSRDAGRCVYRMGNPLPFIKTNGRSLLSLGRWHGGIFKI
jgi:palmitoyltransferase